MYGIVIFSRGNGRSGTVLKLSHKPFVAPKRACGLLLVAVQGRITKVLNMKPPEILGMIEEAAGTRMFEHKKQSAQKTILKKQQKVNLTCVS